MAVSVLFLSHAPEDRGWARMIAATLESEGYQVHSEAAGPEIESAVSSVMDRAGRMVVILSKAHVEIGLGQLRQWLARPGRQERTVVFRIEAVELPRQLPRLPYTDLYSLSMNRLPALVTRALREARTTAWSSALAAPMRKGERVGRQPVESLAPGHAPLTAVWIPASKPGAVERYRSLSEIGRALTSRSRVVLTGGEGLGKTWLANRFVQHCLTEALSAQDRGLPKDYELIAWIDASQSERISALLARVAVKLGLCDRDISAAAAVHALGARLSERGRALLVFDGAGSRRDVLLRIPGDRAHILITSHNPEWASDETSMVVPPFSREESITFLLRHIQSLTREQADQLAERLDDVPLGLSQAVSASTNFTEAADLIRDLDSRAENATRSGTPGVGSALEIMNSLALRQVEQADPAAVELLRVCALIAPEEPLLRDLFTGMGASELSRAPALAAAADGGRGLEGCFETIVRLQFAVSDGDLLRLTPEAVSTVMRQMDEFQIASARAVAETVLLAARPDDGRNPVHWPRWRQLAPYLRALAPELSRGDALRSMANDEVVYLLTYGDARSALERARLLSEGLATHEELRNPVGRRAARNLADCLRSIGEAEQARELHQSLLDHCLAELGRDAPETLESITDVARDLHLLQRDDEARRLNAAAHAAAESSLGGSHPQTLACKGELARNLRALGHRAEARQLNEETLIARTRLLGPEHLDTLETRRSLAQDLMDGREREAARRHLEDVLRLWRRVLAPGHPGVIDAEAALQKVEDEITTQGRLSLAVARGPVSVTRSEPGVISGRGELQESASAAQPGRVFEFVSLATEWSSHHGGLSTFNRELCLALARQGHRVCCVVLGLPSRTEFKEAEMCGVRLIQAHRFYLETDDDNLALPENLPKDADPDYVIGHGRITGPAAQKLEAHLTGVKRVHFIHVSPSEIEKYKTDRHQGDSATRAEDREKEERHLSIPAHRVFAVGPHLHELYLPEYEPYNCHPVRRLDPGFDRVGDGRRPPPGARRKILVLGRMEDAHLKGVDIAVEAVEAWRERRGRSGEKIEICVMGTPRDDSVALTKWIGANVSAPTPSLRIIPYSTDPEDLEHHLLTASLVLMPSRSEGFGMVGLEAIARGTPLLVSLESGLAKLLREVVGDEEAEAVTVSCADPQTTVSRWSERLEQLFSDLPEAFAVAETIRNRMAERKSWKAAVDDFVRELIRLPSPRTRGQARP